MEQVQGELGRRPLSLRFLNSGDQKTVEWLPSLKKPKFKGGVLIRFHKDEAVSLAGLGFPVTSGLLQLFQPPKLGTSPFLGLQYSPYGGVSTVFFSVSIFFSTRNLAQY